ncbi:uncharacterized protein TRUGW13939_03348 [Talaromyces rugulosus]|uniref:HNH nuclease domain-containing protein n=1 Tax=Talaromyces rugulosus TaxID=121627 RepID=A0A7H8QQK4_TALRU|nr:uncharacterized protein TRUGW13939_03348 [Talaromyces rugulosus]QKX56247.1 hypothetical protein TRUGW13939_03348 [Talaromyces rugulosus]
MDSPNHWRIYIPKKRQGDELKDLETKRRRLHEEEVQARKDIKARGTFNEDFFSGASRAESKTLERLRIASDISFSQFQGDFETWQNREAAKDLFSKIRAAEEREQRFKQRSEAMAADKNTPDGVFRGIFMRLFTSARTGMDIKGVGEGARDGTTQYNFRKKLLKDQNSLDTEGYAWCPIIQRRFYEKDMRAGHIFSYKHGQEMMDEIFGKIRPEEMFSSKNGIIIHKSIEEQFDKGVFVIVPDIPDEFSMEQVRVWVTGEVRNYKIRIIDSTFHKLDHGVIEPDSSMTWRSLDNRKLVFKSNARPAARYLYFHYCLQILRRAWKAAPGEKQALTLYDQFGCRVWATPGKYIGRKMLKALVDTLGHEYQDLMIGSSMKSGDVDHLMNCLTRQISETPVPDEMTEEDAYESDNESEDEGEEDVYADE